ncbi:MULTISPECIES: hypothetical protein [unclassified Lentimonas]|uniref:hypothetical protein n=1 Tax=unclassified Lentimonas TaxID=2630993 RepID=UPI001327BFAA|nr:MULTISPECIES: hypothetical protein [unclassified Lentimonas]CAA6691376.1 Unannotated [Lentimonas sp. CC10]CAA6693116.1 Unannotated [Lentimonas sp. CC19]CAA7069001.1 Unannotated [Lentimonas sp. CC11]
MNKETQELEQRMRRFVLVTVATFFIGAAIGTSVFCISYVKKQNAPKHRIERSLTLLNESGKPYCVISEGKEKPTILLLNKDEKPIVILRAIDNNSGGLSILDSEGNDIIRLIENPLGHGTIEILSENKETNIILGTDSKGNPTVVTKTPKI